MSKSNVQRIEQTGEEQLSLFDDPIKRSRKNPSYDFIREALNLAADTVFIKKDSQLYYYIDDESVEAVDSIKVRQYFQRKRFKLIDQINQLEIPFIDTEETNGVSANLTARPQSSSPPKRAEKILLMILAKEEREYLVGDLTEEYSEIQSKHGTRFADIWYYKQVAASAWPLMRKFIRWGMIASIGEWIRRMV